MNRWHIQLFSGFRLREPGGSEILTKSRRLIDLLIILALQNDCSYSRHALAKQVFWDIDEGHDSRMRVLLSRATQKFSPYGKSFLRITGDTVWLDPALIEIDLTSVIQLIEEIGSEAIAGRPVKRIFETLGSMISPLELSPGNPSVDQALAAQKSRLRYLIQSKLVPATGVQFSTSIGSLIEILGLEDAASSSCCSQLMMIYAGIGDIGAIHRVFARHEDALDYDFGAVVSSSTHEVYELALSTEPFEGRSIQVSSVPVSPTSSFGFEAFIQKLNSLTRTARKGDFIEIIGSPGSGKSHALALLYFQLKIDTAVLFIDLDRIDQALDTEELHETATVILFDNYAAKYRSVVQHLTLATSAVIAVIATESVSGLPGSVKHSMPSLSAGTSLELGSGTEFILSMLSDNVLPEDSSTRFRYCSELVNLTAGNPGALIKAADIVKSLGFKAGLEFIHSDLLSYGPLTVDQGASSFRKVILEQINGLSPSHLRCCQFLTRLEQPIAVSAIVSSGLVNPGIIRDLCSIGFVQMQQNHSIKIVEPVRLVLSSVKQGQTLPEEWGQLCDSVCHWIQKFAHDVSNHLELSTSIVSLEVICRVLLERGDNLDGLKMFEAMSKWFPGANFTLDIVLQAEARLLSAEFLDPSDWVSFVVAVGKGLFHKGHYKKLLGLCRWAANFSDFEVLGPEGKYRLLNLFGLAYRGNELPEDAQRCYLEALRFAPSNESKVTLYFNLGCLAESISQHKDALNYYEMAATCYSPRTDRRLMTKNTLDILRLRSEIFPDEVRSVGILYSLFKESSVAQDRFTQAIILTGIGESKLKDTQAEDAGHYMIIGVFLCFQTGFTKNTVILCEPTFHSLSLFLRKSNLVRLSNQIEILALSLRNEPNLGGELPQILHLVLNEVLMQCLHELVQMGISIPLDLQMFFAECDSIQARNKEPVPVISIMESLSLKLSSRRAEEEDEVVEDLKHS
ncbi:hypothetical protein C0431_15600 [bacterium]|nr:hypothetical protein [bacterium]